MPSEQEQSVEITQADRDAAAAFYGPHLSRPGEVLVTAHMRAGKIDESPLIQAFARHRLSTVSNQRDGDKALAVDEFEREYLLLASYCGSDTPGCSNKTPCADCLAMCNVFDGKGGAYLRELGKTAAAPAPDKALMPEAAVGMLAVLKEAEESIRCAAGCDDDADEDTIDSYVMSWGGSPMAVTYGKIVAAIAKATTPTPVKERENAATGEQSGLVAKLRAKGEVVPDCIWLHGIGGHAGEVTWANEPDPSGDPDEAEWAVEYVLAATNAGQVEEATRLAAVLRVAQIGNDQHGEDMIRAANMLIELSTNGQANGEGK